MKMQVGQSIALNGFIAKIKIDRDMMISVEGHPYVRIREDEFQWSEKRKVWFKRGNPKGFIIGDEVVLKSKNEILIVCGYDDSEKKVRVVTTSNGLQADWFPCDIFNLIERN